jgi:hypothetical protein
MLARLLIILWIFKVEKMKKYLLIIAIALFAGAMAFAQDYPDEVWAGDIREQAEAAVADDSTEGYNAQVAPEDSHENPAKNVPSKKKSPFHTPFPYRRWFEVGFDAGVGVANNFVGVSDILKQNIIIDMTKIGTEINKNGISLGFNVDADVFINMNFVEKWGFGLFSTVSGSVNLNLPKSIFTLVSEGNINQHSQSGSITAFGGIFADAGVDIHARPLKDNKLKVSLIPAAFLPIMYIPKASVGFKLSADNALAVTTEEADINVYAPVPLKGLINGDFSDISTDMNGYMDQLGFDLSLAGEYALFPFLDVGASVKNIPIVPSELKNRMNIHVAETEVINVDGLLGGDIPEVEIPEYDSVYDTTSYKVKRPMRFDIYGMLKPFSRDLFIFKPDIGVTFLTPDETPHFNFNLEAQLNTPVIILHASTGYEELLWRHRVLFGLNLRLVEIDIGLDLRSQDFLQSFKMSGAGVTVGARVGL